MNRRDILVGPMDRATFICLLTGFTNPRHLLGGKPNQEPRDVDTAPKQLPISARFSNWLATVGLKGFVQRLDESTNEEGAKVLSVVTLGGLDLAMSARQESSVYERFAFKLLSFSDLAKSTIIVTFVALFEGSGCGQRTTYRSFRLGADGNWTKTERSFAHMGCMEIFTRIVKRPEPPKSLKLVPPFRTTRLSETSETTSIEAIKKRLTEKLSRDGGSVTISGITDHWLSLVTRDLRGVVIPRKKYWERLQVFVILESKSDMIEITLVIDGKYGSGLTPPTEYGYIDMEPAHTGSLTEFGQSLLTVAIGK